MTSPLPALPALPVLVAIAENAIRSWAGDVDRTEALRVLRKWQFYPGLSNADRTAVLARFPETIAAIAAEVPAELKAPRPTKEILASYHRMTAIADARRAVVDKAKPWRASCAAVYTHNLSREERELIDAVDVLARIEETPAELAPVTKEEADQYAWGELH